MEMTFDLEADGVHFYCSSPEVTRKLIERAAEIVGQSRAEDPRRGVQPTKAGDGPRPADPQAPRT
jgi:hypothetical protein